MRRRGNCFDNAVMEVLFSTAKSEPADRFGSIREGTMALFANIKVFYNQPRRHSAPGLIPARNRPEDLAVDVETVLSQLRLPEELIIVDQSPNDQSKRAAGAVVGGRMAGKVKDRHDATVAGLVAAKQLTAQSATSEIVCFFEDDIILDEEYFKVIEAAFIADANMLGCCGLITNAPRRSGNTWRCIASSFRQSSGTHAQAFRSILLTVNCQHKRPVGRANRVAAEGVRNGSV